MRWFLLLILAACSYKQSEPEPVLVKSDRYIVFLVEARHLDYSTNPKLLRTIAKHPSDGTKNSDVGHAWILFVDGDEVICGGHSGETGEFQLKYIEGVFSLADQGDPNPIRYLFSKQRDGFFQVGSGGHTPTFAGKRNLTEKEASDIRDVIASYSFRNYSLTQNSCCSLIEAIAFKLGLIIDSSLTIDIQPYYKGIKLWEDPCFSKITIQSPDRLEVCLKDLVKQGELEEVTPLVKERKCFRCRMKKTGEDLRLLPARTVRWLLTF